MIRRVFAETWGLWLLLAGWQAWVSLAGYNAIVMPRPADVFGDLAAAPGAYLGPTATTLATAALGLAGGLLLGCGLAVLAYASRLLDGLLTPLGLVFSSIPVVCLIPVLARLFGYDQRTVLAAVVVITFFPAFVFAGAGLRATPPMSEALFAVLGARGWVRLVRLALPSAVPNTMIAFRVTAAQSILAAMVAEFLMGTGGLGQMLAASRADFQMSRAIGASLVAMALSTVVYVATAAIERRVRARWR